MFGGISFRKAPKAPSADADKVKTKAKKKGYITGAHGSGAAKKKAKIRERRANKSKR
ncbi:MAG: hypothetical protein J6129_05125 [Bacteroidaceae bacterium]|nr:hypothetical protein [Bacteroidaceae bacterium]